MARPNNTIPMDLRLDDRPDTAVAAVDPNSEAAGELFLSRFKAIWPNLSPSIRAKFRSFVNTQAAKDFDHPARMILDFLNTKRPGKRGYQPVEANLKFIRARLMDGATVSECRGVIAMKARQVDRHEFPARYFRPETLFNATKFNSYRGELGNG